MILVYQILDFLVTVTEAFSICIPMYCLLKKPRFQKSIALFTPVALTVIVVFLTTWFSAIGIFKIPLVFLLVFLCMRYCYKDTVILLPVVIELWYAFCCLLPESVAFVAANWIWNGDILTIVAGIGMAKWQIYVLSILLRLLSMAVLYGLLKNFHYKIQPKDFLILTVDFLIVLVPFVVVKLFCNTFG